MPIQSSQNTTHSMLVDLPTDEESDYSIGDISVITDSDSISSCDEDECNDAEELMETDVSELELEGDESIELGNGEMNMPVAMEVLQSETAWSEDASTDTAVPVESTNQLSNNIAVSTDSFGFVVTIDNLDMNVRPSFQRIDHVTKSYHFCHAYAVLNRIDTSTLEDGQPSGTLSCGIVLPDALDLERLRGDIRTLIFRQVKIV